MGVVTTLVVTTLVATTPLVGTIRSGCGVVIGLTNGVPNRHREGDIDRQPRCNQIDEVR